MLRFAKAQVGKPFSQTGMARSLFWPRKSDHKSWYCAELVAACLQVGGLMSPNSATGSATPSSLYKLYKDSGAVAANPCTLRRQFAGMDVTEQAIRMNLLGLKGATGGGAYAPVSQYQQYQHQQHQQQQYQHQQHQQHPPRPASPPRMSFKQLPSTGSRMYNSQGLSQGGGAISLTLASLDMHRR